MGKSAFHSDLKGTLYLKDPPYFLELTSFFFASCSYLRHLKKCFQPRVIACCAAPCWKQKLFRVRHFIKLLPPKEFQYGDIKSGQFWFWNESVNKKRIVAQCKPGENTLKSWDREIVAYIGRLPANLGDLAGMHFQNKYCPDSIFFILICHC